jgi:hypothetical protein
MVFLSGRPFERPGGHARDPEISELNCGRSADCPQSAAGGHALVGRLTASLLGRATRCELGQLALRQVTTRIAILFRRTNVLFKRRATVLNFSNPKLNREKCSRAWDAVSERN